MEFLGSLQQSPPVFFIEVVIPDEDFRGALMFIRVSGKVVHGNMKVVGQCFYLVQPREFVSVSPVRYGCGTYAHVLCKRNSIDFIPVHTADQIPTKIGSAFFILIHSELFFSFFSTPIGGTG